MKALIIIHRMRLVSIIMLLSLSFTVFLAVLVVHPSHIKTEDASLMTLNVCHLGGSGIHSNQDIPFICEYAFIDINVPLKGFYRDFKRPFSLPLIAFYMDQPPRV